MTLQSEDGQPLTLQISGLGSDTATITTPDATLSGRVVWEGPHGGWWHDAETNRITRFYGISDATGISLWLDGQVYRFARPAPTARRAGGAAAAGGPEVKAPMPGTVLKLAVAEGDIVAAGAPVVILESMKMEMTLTAPIAGRVQKISCAPGELVAMQQVLVTLIPGETA